MQIQIEHDTQSKRFLSRVDSGSATLSYASMNDGVLDFRSTFVPPKDRKRGIGEQIVLHALRYARDHGFRVRPSCDFVSAVLERHSEFDAIVDR